MCRDFFKVKRVEYDGDRICLVDVENTKTNKILTFGEPATVAAETAEKKAERVSAKDALILENMLSDNQKAWVFKKYHIEHLADLNIEQYASLIKTLQDRDGNESEDN